MAVTYGYPTEEDIKSWPAKQAEAEKKELLEKKKRDVDALEIKNLRKLYDREDITAVNAERLKLRNEIKALEKI
jgi:hypothetical protein